MRPRARPATAARADVRFWCELTCGTLEYCFQFSFRESSGPSWLSIAVGAATAKRSIIAAAAR